MATIMSATDARTFPAGERVSSIIRVSTALAERARPGCQCQPYADVFTFRRWIAQGRVVQKGEHGIRLPVIVNGERTDKATGDVTPITLRRTSAVFCRCQTDELANDRPGTATRAVRILADDAEVAESGGGFTFETIGGLVKGRTA